VSLADYPGYFRGTRLRPHYVTPVAAAQVVPLVGSGDLDFGKRIAPLVISAIGNGADIKVIAGGTGSRVDTPHMVYSVASDSTIHSGRDFKGKMIALGNDGACANLVKRRCKEIRKCRTERIGILIS